MSILYNVQFKTTEDIHPLNHDLDMKMCADSKHGAVVACLNRLPKNSAVRVAFREGKPVYAWVWNEKTPTHANGNPMCVDMMKLEAGPKKV